MDEPGHAAIDGPSVITSVQNPRIKHLVKLRSRRTRDKSGTFLIEGFRELTRALDAEIAVSDLYSTPALWLGDNEAALVERATAAGARLTELSVDAFRKVAYRDRPEGLLAVAQQFDTSLDRIDPAGSPLLLVVESIEKPGNLGTMLRTADGLAVDAVIVADPQTDPFNPNTVRASIGSLFAVPLAVADSGDALAWLERHRITTVALTPDAERPIWDIDLTGPTAIAIGSEQLGLSEPWLIESRHRAVLPMPGTADSLNAAVAAAVSLFEAVRQRSS